MADVREPVAWVNSARMSGALYMYIEGASDERFWNKFINSDVVKIQVCNGRNKVLNVVREHIKQGMFHYLAVIDNDFDVINDNRQYYPNLFYNDDHDLEMMMYHKGKAFQEMKNSIDRGNKIAQYEESGHCVLDETLEMTIDIGYCKLAGRRLIPEIEYTLEDERYHEIIRPSYEDIMDGKTGQYDGVKRIISKIVGFLKSHHKHYPSEVEYNLCYQEERKREYDKWQISNGHDVSYLLPYVIRRRCKHRNSKMDIDFIDSVLLAAYSKEDLMQTEVYNSMNQWSEAKQIKIFRN